MSGEGRCNGCGACCDPVVLPMTRSEILGEITAEPEVRRWARDVLVPMSPREALALEPHLGRISIGIDPYTGQLGSEVFYYRCGWFDRETRTCTHYDERPSPCRDYPWGNPIGPTPMANLAPWCGYRADVGQSVTIRPSTPEGRAAAVDADTDAQVAAGTIGHARHVG